MGLETATFISDLVSTNPLSTDKKKQGDDHLRLLKEVLQATFPGASKAFRLPRSVAKSANYTVVAGDQNATIVCDTTTAFTLTLPTLVVGDAGWEITVIKVTSDANPVFVMPPTGLLNTYTKIRRSIPYAPIRIIWVGTGFVAERASREPIGSCLDYFGTTLPPGHLWADGATFLAADYVELNAALGGNTKPDCRGRVLAGKDDMGGTSANRLTGLTGGIDGDLLGITGGEEGHILLATGLPAHAHTITDVQHGHALSPAANAVQTTVNNNLGPQAGGSFSNLTTLTVVNSFSGITGTNNSTGGGLAHNNVQPTMITNKILVAE